MNMQLIDAQFLRGLMELKTLQDCLEIYKNTNMQGDLDCVNKAKVRLQDSVKELQSIIAKV